MSIEPRMDRRGGKRATWHEEAKRMRSAGMLCRDIAVALGRGKSAVEQATRGICGDRRRNHGDVSGFGIGYLKRVAIAFTDEQVEAINALAKAENKSFSGMVAALADEAIQVRGDVAQ